MMQASTMQANTPLILRPGDAVPAPLQGAVLAIGNFDGVHRGHQAVIGMAANLARRMGRKLAVMTFEPHPRAFFRPGEPFFRLTDASEKAAILGHYGVDAIFVRPFDAALASTTAADFLDQIVIAGCQAGAVVVGHDFHFGKGREGTPDFLQREGEARGLTIAIVPALRDHETPVSSSAIRAALHAGDIATANALLGHRWTVSGEIVHGDKRGRLLGYPTANMILDPACGLRHGIYAVRMAVDGAVHDGVASFGRRPTFDDGAPRLETFLFDYSGDLYGKIAWVECVAFLRGEAKFVSVEDLIAQMDRDSAAAKAALATDPVPSLLPL
jgi:riboflavin kinase/FMN adenylyltransferase